MALFDRIRWRDPVSQLPLEPVVQSRTPSGVPLAGALRVQGTNIGYPIVDAVARLTPELAQRHRAWLTPLSLEPPKAPQAKDFQAGETVDSFGWQWVWNSNMRSEADLRMRVADRFGITPDDFQGKVTLDAGAGAGDQSAYILRHGGSVVSLDLSGAVEVIARKLRLEAEWVGVQGDITRLPFPNSVFDRVYCEGVIQHTRDSAMTVAELCRVVRQGGMVLATHYTRAVPHSRIRRLWRKVRLTYYESLRNRLSRMERYRLLFLTGMLASLSYVPFLGFLIRRSGTAIYNDLMPDFKTTWTNTFDYYGSHSFQRFISTEEFRTYFERVAGIRLLQGGEGVVAAVKDFADGDEELLRDDN